MSHLRKHTILIGIALAIVLMGLSATSDAEPYYYLGEEGVHGWTSSSPTYFPLMPINSGERVLQVWTDYAFQNGNKQVYFQILGNDGTPLYNPPRRIGELEMVVLGTAIGQDDNGFTYICWFESSQFNPLVGTLFIQKINRSGDRPWGAGAREVVEVEYFEHDFNSVRAGTVVPDGRGGCYYVCDDGFFAIDSEGRLREDWEWHFQHVENEDLSRGYVFGDHNGGFWYSESGTDDENNRIGGINHLTYEGEKLWDEAVFPVVDGLPEGYELDFGRIAFLEDKLIVHFKIDDRRGFCVVDYEFNLIGEQFVHYVPDDVSLRGVLVLTNGNVLFVYQGNNVLTTYNALAYNPTENSFPWGDDGLLIGAWEREVNGERISVGFGAGFSQLPDESIIVPIEFWQHPDGNVQLYRYDDRGRRLWRYPKVIEHVRDSYSILSGRDQSVWFSGRKGVTDHSEESTLYINKIDEEENLVFERSVSIGFAERGRLYNFIAWQNRDIAYSLVANDLGKFIKYNFNAAGHFIGGNNGDIFFDPDVSNILEYEMQLVGEKVVIVWRAEQENLLYCTILNRDGEVEWSEQVFTGTFGLNLYDPTIVASYDGQQFTLLVIESDNNDRRKQTIIHFDMADPDSYWRTVSYDREESVIGVSYFSHGAVFDETHLYSYVWRGQHYCVVSKYDLTGHRIWERYISDEIISERNTGFHGVIPREEGGLWLCFSSNRQTRGNNSNNVWLEHIDELGRQTGDYMMFYEDSLTERLSSSDNFHVFSEYGNIWLITDRSMTEYPLQCLTQEGERLLGPQGFIPEAPEGYKALYQEALPDGNGGLWLAWSRRNQQDYQLSTARILHFNSIGQVDDGWELAGEPVFGEEPYTGFDQLFAFDDHSVFVVGSKSRFSSGAQYIQHISFIPPEDVETEIPPIVNTFSITSVHPNPFNAHTKIRYQLSNPAEVSISVFDASGRLLAKYIKNHRSAGEFTLSVDGSDWASGSYIARLETGGIVHEAKLVVVK